MNAPRWWIWMGWIVVAGAAGLTGLGAYEAWCGAHVFGLLVMVCGAAYGWGALRELNLAKAHP